MPGTQATIQISSRAEAPTSEFPNDTDVAPLLVIEGLDPVLACSMKVATCFYWCRSRIELMSARSSVCHRCCREWHGERAATDAWPSPAVTQKPTNEYEPPAAFVMSTRPAVQLETQYRLPEQGCRR